MTHSPRFRRWRKVAIVLVALLLFVEGARLLIGHFLLKRIQTAVQQNLHATLSAGTLSYRPPYSFVIPHCHFVLPHHGAPPDVIDIAELRVTLNRLPFGGGPVLVKEIEMIDPVIQIAKSPRELTNFQTGGPPSKPKKLPSQIVQIGRLIIRNGRILLQDQTPQRNTWNDIRLDVDAQGIAPSDYSFQFFATGPVARLHAQGVVNVDQKSAALDQFVLWANFDSPAPAADPLRQFAKQLNLHGFAGLNGHLRVNDPDPARNGLWATVWAKDLSILPTTSENHIDSIRLNALASVDRQGVQVNLAKFFARADQTAIAFDGGKITSSPGVLNIVDLTGSFGNDQLLLSTQLPLVSLEHGIIRMNNIDGRVNFHPPLPTYADPLDTIFAQFQPAGPWNVRGWVIGEAVTGRIVNFDLNISTDGDASANITARNVELSQIKSDWEALPDHIEVSDFHCIGLGGNLDTAGTIGCARPYPYQGQVTSHHADLSRAIALLQAQSVDQTQFQGLLDLRASFSGSGPYSGEKAADLFTADGQFEIHKGILWSIPVLQRIADSTSIGRQALTMSEAAAYFKVANKEVTLHDAAINAPVLGLQGNGTVDFDGNLNLDVLAAPLADWQTKIHKIGIPIIGGVVGDFAGTVQDLFNKATGTLLYTFHITGDAANPQITTVPAPILTRGTQRLFGYMLGHNDGGLLGLLENPSTEPTTLPETPTTTQPAADPRRSSR
jgi:hypothetical protein